MTDRDPYERAESWGRLAVDLLTTPWPYVFLGIPTVLALVIFQPELPKIVISTPWKVFLVALVLGGALGAVPIDRILAWLFDPPKRYIVVPPETEGDQGGVFELTPRQFEELTVTDGHLYEWPGCKHPTYEAEGYHPEANVASGTWRGSASPSELIRNEQEIAHIRGQLERLAREGEILKTRAKAITRQAILENARTLIKQYDRVNPLDPERVDELIEEALAGADWDAEVKAKEEQQGDAPAEARERRENGQEATQQPVATAGEASGE